MRELIPISILLIKIHKNISDNSSRIGANARNITKIQGDITTNKNDINTINNTLEKGLYFSSDTGASIKKIR